MPNYVVNYHEKMWTPITFFPNQTITTGIKQARILKDHGDAILAVEWPFVGLPDNCICWATSMPMASISPDLHALNFKNCSNMVKWILVELENDNFSYWVFGVFKKKSQWKSV